MEAVLDAFPTYTAARTVVDLITMCVEIMGAIWADIDAFQAQLAFLREVLYLLLKAARLGVMAPMAVKVAPFQEDAGADAWSIVDGEPLDIEDLTLHSAIILEARGRLGYLSGNSTIIYELHPKIRNTSSCGGFTGTFA